MRAPQDYTVTAKLHAGHTSVIFKATRQSDGKQVVIKALRGERPTPRALAQLRREFSILQDLDLPGVIEVFELTSYDGGLALVMEDNGGFSLNEELDGRPMELRRALMICRNVAKTLAALHAQSIVHKDIKPHNILVTRESAATKLIDFGIATRLNEESPVPVSPDAIEGTLFYMAPEQSGRMNRIVDQRADLYALGITLYQLLTGTLPFASGDAMELVHSHIARIPVAPKVRVGALPSVVSDIVMRLLAKDPEDRYQSAPGLVADLNRCLDNLEDGNIEPFEIGERDFTARLWIPQRLYGRDAELEALTVAYDRARLGRTELLLVRGPAGIGKTVLVHELHKSIAKGGGRMVSGKFDRLKRRTPFAALLQTLEVLVQQLLTESASALAERRRQLRRAVGSNGQVLIDLLPAMEQLLGAQLPVPSLGPTETRNRFRLVLQAFIRDLCASEAPLVLFIDNLQWADPATIDLLEQLLVDPESRGLLLVGSYREAEVDAAHPFRHFLAKISPAKVHEISLAPLDQASIEALLRDTLHRPIDANLRRLATLLVNKTHGNPFFVGQFIVTLHERGLLTANVDNGDWSWDSEAIANLPSTDNVVELMGEKLRQLAPEAQRLLIVAACIGFRFDLVTLAEVSEIELSLAANTLLPAMQAGLIVPLDPDYRLFTTTDSRIAEEMEMAESIEVTCRFLHDRVQSASLSLCEHDELVAIHLKIGRHLHRRDKGPLHGDQLFTTLRHLNEAAALIADPAERRELASKNLTASRTAKKATAYEAAAAYAASGIDFLAENAWDDDRDLAFSLALERAECDYLSGRFEEADRSFARLLERTSSRVERTDIYGLQVQLFSARGKFVEALAAGSAGLALFDESLPQGDEAIMGTFMALHASIQGALAGSDPSSLVDAPRMDDPVKQAQLSLLHELFGPAFVADARLGAIITMKMTLLSLTEGNSELSAFAYASYGYSLAGPLGQPVEARKFGSLALDLLDRYPAPSVGSRVHFGVGFYFGLTQPLRTTLPHFDQALKLGLNVGEFLFSSQGSVYTVLTKLRLGEQIPALRAELTTCDAIVRRTQDAMSAAQVTLLQHVLNAFVDGLPWWEISDDDRGPTEAQWLAQIDAYALTVVRCLHNICKLNVLAFFGEHALALPLIDECAAVLPFAIGAPYLSDFPFAAALLLASAATEAPADERASMLEKISAHRESLAAAAAFCPENELHRLLLVDAEIARLKGDQLTAMNTYEEAISEARRRGYAHHEALASERCADFHSHHGRPQISRSYLSHARFAYERWGAIAKVRALDKLHPALLARSEGVGVAPSSSGVLSTTSSSRPTGNHGLNLASVFKASQALSAEIALEPLIEKIVAIMVENAGARRGALILDRNGELQVVAESTADGGSSTHSWPQSIEVSPSVPGAVIHYVVHSRESVVLDDAINSGPFTADPYIVQRGVRSLLCIPLVHKSVSLGAVYLEHELTAGVFPEERLRILELIITQAAIAIENANLYANMERLVDERTHALNQANRSLRSSNAELDAFGRTVAHDLKNPLGVVTGYTEYLYENSADVDAEELHEVLGNIRHASRTAESIINELLLLAGVRKEQVKVSQLDMGAIIERVIERMKFMRSERAGMIVCPEEWHGALGYAPWIEEAWVNYVSNGLKYGGTPPVLTLGSTLQVDGMTRFWVRDNGNGIDKEGQSKLFTEFARLDEVKAEGHGLGLSIVRRIIERLGGQVGAESTLGEGSLFYFELPALPRES